MYMYISLSIYPYMSTHTCMYEHIYIYVYLIIIPRIGYEIIAQSSYVCMYRCLTIMRMQ